MFNPILIVYISVSIIPKHYSKNPTSSYESFFRPNLLCIQLFTYQNTIKSIHESLLILYVMTLLDENPGLPPEFVTRNNA